MPCPDPRPSRVDLWTPHRRRFCLGGLGLVAATRLAAQEAPRRPGDGRLPARPDSQGAATTWSKLLPAELVQTLRHGGHVLFFRHGQTDWQTRDALPQSGLGDRATQRNLSDEGREQGRRTGELFRSLGIRFGAVYSSPYFRARDFAELVAGRPAEVTNTLLGVGPNSLNGHRELLSRMPASGANTLLCGHQVAVVELGIVRLHELEEGSCLVFRPNGEPSRLEAISLCNHSDLLAMATAR